MAIRLDSSIRQALLDSLNTLISGGSLEFIDNSVGTLAPTDTVQPSQILATATLPNPFSAGATTNGELIANAIPAVNPSVTGTVGFFRIKTSAGDVAATGTVSLTGGGGDITVDNVSFTIGGVVNVTSFKFIDGSP